jgi:DNA-directed RNA polymerase specialized sigma24 family protein
MRKHPRQDIEAALDALLKEPALEEVLRADGWAAVQPLWRGQLYLIGRRKRLQDADIEDRIQEVLAAILARWEDHRQLGVGRLLVLSRKMMHDKVTDEIRRRDRQRALPLETLPSELAAGGSNESGSSEDKEEWSKWALARVDELKHCNKLYYDLLSAHHVEGRSCKELAAEAGRSVDAMKNLLRRAREEVRRRAAKHPPGGWAPP